MGYYSNVTIACDSKTCLLIADACDNAGVVTRVHEYCCGSDPDMYCMIYIDNIKWYEGGAFVKEIEGILNGIDARLDRERNAFGVILRDGEDSYDMTIKKYGNEEIAFRFYPKTILSFC